MFDSTTLAAKLMDLEPGQLAPSWELVDKLYRLIQLQHRAIGFALDKLQEHDPSSGFTFAAAHRMTLQTEALRLVYTAVSIAEQWCIGGAKEALDEVTADPDQYTPAEWFHNEKVEAARKAGLSRHDVRIL